MILRAELFEQMTMLDIAVNLVPYMTGSMHLGSAAAANTVTNFIGTSFMLCLLGGFIADTYLGRYLTIGVFCAVQSAGVMVLTISTVAPALRPAACGDATGQSADCVPANGTQLGVLYLGLYMTALGTGGLKSSVSGFGSDQFDDPDDGERKKMMRFFNWFYFFVSIGALLAVTVLVYVQDNIGRRYGYGICAAAHRCAASSACGWLRQQQEEAGLRSGEGAARRRAGRRRWGARPCRQQKVEGREAAIHGARAPTRAGTESRHGRLERRGETGGGRREIGADSGAHGHVSSFSTCSV